MNYLNRHSPNTLARLDEYGRFDIGGPIGIGDIRNQFTQDPTMQAAGNMALDVAPGTGEYRSVTQHLPQAYQNYQNAQTPIQKTLRAAEMGLEGGSTVAGMVPGMKAAATGIGSLLMMMAKKNHDLMGIARSPQAARQLGIIGYHGTDREIIGEIDAGSYITPNPEYAGRYARGDGGAIYPFDLDESGMLDTRTPEGRALWDEYAAEHAKAIQNPEYNKKLGPSGLPDHNDEGSFTSWYIDKYERVPNSVMVDENNGEIAAKVYEPNNLKPYQFGGESVAQSADSLPMDEASRIASEYDRLVAARRAAFSKTTTDMPTYDNMIKNPEYWRKEKGISPTMTEIKPQYYLDRVEGYKGPAVDPAKVKEYAEKIRNGEQFPALVLDYSSGRLSQEGRHRALAAIEAGIDRVPVLEVRKID